MTTTTIDNGVNVEALHGARAALTEAPPAAAFKWRAQNEWGNGTHSRSTVEKFFGLGEEQAHTQAFVLDTDHPAQFAAGDNGITPIEMMLAGLAGCLTAGIASIAQHRGIQLRSVVANVEGDLDMRGTLGIDPDVRNGFGDVTVTYDIEADATSAEIAALVAQSQKRSPVFDIMTNPTTVTVSVR
jgi:uncharacterized OsmC-like protein